MARIIYVEDDDLVADMVKEALTVAGHLVGVIDHGSLAYDTIIFKRPDLILLDCALPGMKGVEILRRVRAIPEIYLTPIIMLTALADAADIDAAMAAGANDYIVKPIDIADLCARIDVVLTNSLYRSKVSGRLSNAADAAVQANAVASPTSPS